MLDHKCELRFGTNVLASSTIRQALTPTDFSDPHVFDSMYAGPDYVFIKLPKPLPRNYNAMQIADMSVLQRLAVGRDVHVAGYGEADNDSFFTLNDGSIKVSATNFDSARGGWPTTLPQWFKQYFLETDQSGAVAACSSDAGGPVFIESGESGHKTLVLLGLYLKHALPFSGGNCKSYAWALRADAFASDAVQFQNSLVPSQTAQMQYHSAATSTKASTPSAYYSAVDIAARGISDLTAAALKIMQLRADFTALLSQQKQAIQEMRSGVRSSIPNIATAANHATQSPASVVPVTPKSTVRTDSLACDAELKQALDRGESDRALALSTKCDELQQKVNQLTSP